MTSILLVIFGIAMVDIGIIDSRLFGNSFGLINIKVGYYAMMTISGALVTIFGFTRMLKTPKTPQR